MLFAPLLHARTKNNDFPSGLLVTPNDFSSEDVVWARSYITQSTRYFEAAGKQGRRVIFSNEKVVVTGLSIRIQDLYTLCGKQPKYDKVDGNRTNFAFIGLVIPKEAILAPFDVPYEVFLEQYETYMQKLWDIFYIETGVAALHIEYTDIALPPAVDVCDIPNLASENTKCVLDNNYAPLNSIFAKVTIMAKNRNSLGFCSDIPNANSVIEGKFEIVTSANAQHIIHALDREQAKESYKKNNPLSRTVPLHDPDISNSNKEPGYSKQIVNEIEKTWNSIPKVVKVIGGLMIIVLLTTANKRRIEYEM